MDSEEIFNRLGGVITQLMEISALREGHFQIIEKNVLTLEELIQETEKRNGDAAEISKSTINAFTSAQDIIGREREELEAVRSGYNDEIKSIKENYEQRLKEAREDAEQIRKDYEDKIAKLEKHIEALQNQNDKLVEQHDWKDKQIAEMLRSALHNGRALVTVGDFKVKDQDTYH